MKRITFDANSTIFDEWDNPDRAYLIREGVVEIRTGAHGKFPQRLALRSKGDVIGEMALVDDQPRMASAIALRHTEVVEIPREDFRRRVDMLDPLMKKVILLMVGRLREMGRLLTEYRGDDFWTD